MLILSEEEVDILIEDIKRLPVSQEMSDLILELQKTEKTPDDLANLVRIYKDHVRKLAEQDITEALFQYGKILLSSDINRAKLLLKRAKDNHCIKANYLWTQVEAQRNSYISAKEIKEMVKKAVDADLTHAKQFLAKYHQDLAESMKTEHPIITKSKKRGFFRDSFIKSEMASSPVKKPKKDISNFDIYLNSSNPIKVVRIPDTTTVLMQHLESSITRDKISLKNNAKYMTANITLVFSEQSAVTSQFRRRIKRTIAFNLTGTPSLLTIKSPNVCVENDQEIETYHSNCIQKLKEDVGTKKQRSLNPTFLPNFFPEEGFKKPHVTYAYHAEHALFTYLLNQLEDVIRKFKRQHHSVFIDGCKVYAAIIDVYSTNALVDECKAIIFHYQNLIVDKLTDLLKKQGHLPTVKNSNSSAKTKLRLVTRIRAGRNDTSCKENLPSKDGFFKHMDIYHSTQAPSKDVIEPAPLLVFGPSSRAPRSKK